MMHMSPFRDVIFMMQMSHAGVRMQSLSMMVPMHIFNCDANVSLQRWRYKNLVVQMPSNGYVMMQMSFCRDVMIQISLCGYVIMRMYPCRYAMNANAPLCVYHDMSALMQTQFIQKVSSLNF